MPRDPKRVSHDRSSADLHSVRNRAGVVRFCSIPRDVVGLILVAFIVSAWFSVSDCEPVEEADRMQLVPGLPDSQNWSLAVSPTGLSFATSDIGGRLVLWNNKQGNWVPEQILPFDRYVRKPVFSPDGRFLAVGGFRAGLILWDLRPNGKMQILPVPIERVNAIAFSPDGDTIAATTALNGQIVLWDLAASRVRTILRCAYPVLHIAFSPDGRYLGSGERENGASISVWNLETGRRTLEITESTGSIMALGFTVDGTMLATAAGKERPVRLWDLKSGRLSRRLDGHAFGTNSIAFSSDGMTMATAGNDGMVRVWNITTGKQTNVFNGQAIRLSDLAFFPDGRTLVATTTNDSDIRLIDVSQKGSEHGHPTTEARVNTVLLVNRSSGATRSIERASDPLFSGMRAK
jgi:WD40 repeat protein